MFSEKPQDGMRLDVVRLDINGILDDEEVMRAAGAVGYAFRVHFQGNGLSEPIDVQRKGGLTSFTLESNGYQDDKDKYLDFLDDCIQYIFGGTPIRKTDRSGPGTKGTRLVNGLQRLARVRLWVDEEVERNHKVSVILDGVEQFAATFYCKDRDVPLYLDDLMEEYVNDLLQERE
jgi:hypothetical protein